MHRPGRASLIAEEWNQGTVAMQFTAWLPSNASMAKKKTKKKIKGGKKSPTRKTKKQKQTKNIKGSEERIIIY